MVTITKVKSAFINFIIVDMAVAKKAWEIYYL